MLRLRALGPLCLLLAACQFSMGTSTVAPTGSRPAKPRPAIVDDRSKPVNRAMSDLSAIVESVRKKHGVPGLGAAIVGTNGLRALGVAGLRRADQEGAIEPGDRFHLGSDTKSMTAFLIGRLVQDGRLSWDVTLGEVLPDAAKWMHKGYRGVALLQLLRHRGGLPPNALLFSPEVAGVGAAPPDKQRLELARRFLAMKPAQTPGAKFLYSNVGYVVAGLVAELTTKLPWETLVRQEIFDPLGMASCGFGPTASGDDNEQPWAHAFVDGTYRPTDIDNPSYLGPAGTVHCNLEDWGKFAAVQYDDSPSALVSAETLEKLHTAVPLEDGRGGYALGWLVAESKRFDGPMLTHDGSNTVNYASILVIPRMRAGIVVACNAGGEPSQKAVVELMRVLMQTLVDERKTRS